MHPTRILRLDPPGIRPDYKAYRSPYAPKYKVQPNFHGINQGTLTRVGLTAGLFAGCLGVGAVFFASGIPRVRTDILENLPLIGSYFRQPEVAPEDNPF